MRALAVLLCCVVLSGLARAVEPAADAKPILQLDTGGHMGAIYGLLFAKGGKLIVSAGDDKVIRVWDRETNKIVSSMRGDSGAGEDGKISAIALSPDEKLLAVAGEFGHAAIRLYDFETGALAIVLLGHDQPARSVAFSDDGRLLLSGGSDGTAIIWDLEARRGLRRLQTPAAQDSANVIEAVAFTANHEYAATTGADNTVHLWRVNSGQLTATLRGHSGRVRSLAVSPNNVIASGDAAGAIRLWETATGKFLGEWNNQSASDKRPASVRGLAFSPDGLLLLSGNGGRGDTYRVRLWDLQTRTEKLAYDGHDNGVYAVAISPDGRWAATAGGNNKEIHVLDLTKGGIAQGPDGKPSILAARGKPVWAAGISSDGSKIAWGALKNYVSATDRGPLLREMRIPRPGDAKLGTPQPASEGQTWLRGASHDGSAELVSRPGGPPNNREDEILALSENGAQKFEIGAGEKEGLRHKSFSFADNGKMIVTGGGTGTFAAYARDGSYLGSFAGHEDIVWALAPSPDGRLLLSAGGDQTVRLWNLKTRELIVTLFDGPDGEWVMWTPQGYYTGSPGADKIVGWQINKGAGNAADYVTAEQLRKHLNRPDIVAKAIELASAEEAARTSYGTSFKLSDLLARPAPRLHILSPTPGSAVDAAGSVQVKIALDATPDPVTRIRIQVNGRQLDDFLPANGPKFEPGEQEFKVPLAKGQNTIAVTALNEVGWSKAQDGWFTLANAATGDLDKRGTLYILAIGVSKYPGIPELCKPNASCDLAFTGDDATAFADSIERGLGALHEKVVRRVLVNSGKPEDAPTAASITDALGILGDAQPNDTVAVFLAGHGFNDGPKYRFVPTDAALASGTFRPSTVVPWYAIEEAIDGAKGRRLLFVDTCHSAGAYNERLGNAAYYANILAYSSARWDQEALESDAFKHGLFTQALVEGLGGAADGGKNGRVDTVQLSDYLQKRVPELAKPFEREQNPQVFKGRDAEVYTLAVAHRPAPERP